MFKCSTNFINYFQILELEPTIDINIIKKKYRNLSLKKHPDKCGGLDYEYKKITNAYTEILNGIENNTIIDNSSNISNSSNINNKITEYNTSIEENIYTQDIEIDLNITFEQSFFGTSLPINVTRFIKNNNLFKKETETLYINIPISSDNNEIIIIEKKGNCYNNNYSNIKIIIKLLNHDLFTRKGLDIIYTAKITFKESLLGIDFIINHINGKKYKIKNNEGHILTPKSMILLRKLGFQRNNIFGNFIINFDIIYPITLSKEILNILKDLL